MDPLTVLLIVAPLTTLDLDLSTVAPGYRIGSKEQVIAAVENHRDRDGPDVEVKHFLGRGRAYGYIECNFVIRAASSEHALRLLALFVERLNASQLVRERKKKEGMGQFNFALISDEASNAEIHDLVEYAAGHKSHLIVLNPSDFGWRTERLRTDGSQLTRVK